MEEIDADIAAVQQQIAMRNALGYKTARAKAILDHDTSGLERIYALMNQAEQNKIAREDTQKFTAEQNDLNRGLQALQYASSKEEAKAKAMQMLQNAYTIRKNLPIMATQSEIENADAGLNFARHHAMNQGFGEEELKGFTVNPEDVEALKNNFALYSAVLGNEDLDTINAKDAWLADFIQNHGSDPAARTAVETRRTLAGMRTKRLDEQDASTVKLIEDALKHKEWDRAQKYVDKLNNANLKREHQDKLSAARSRKPKPEPKLPSPFK
jgi:hypothetical protein